MGKKILLGWLVLTCLLISMTANAEHVVYLNYISVPVPKNDVSRSLVGTSEPSSHVNIPSMDIQQAYLIVNGLTMTLKMKMGGTPIYNSSIYYRMTTSFSYNDSFKFVIYATKYGSNSSQFVIQTFNNRCLTNCAQPHLNYSNIPTHINGMYIYWNIDLTSINSIAHINQLFIKYTIFRQIQAKYESHPSLAGTVSNQYRHQEYNVLVQDTFSLSQTSPPAISKYFWPILISISIFIGIIAVLIINRKKIRERWQNWKIKSLPKNNELYPDDK